MGILDQHFYVIVTELETTYKNTTEIKIYPERNVLSFGLNSFGTKLLAILNRAHIIPKNDSMHPIAGQFALSRAHDYQL